MNHEEYEEICSTLPDLARAIEAEIEKIQGYKALAEGALDRDGRIITRQHYVKIMREGLPDLRLVLSVSINKGHRHHIGAFSFPSYKDAHGDIHHCWPSEGIGSNYSSNRDHNAIARNVVSVLFPRYVAEWTEQNNEAQKWREFNKALEDNFYRITRAADDARRIEQGYSSQFYLSTGDDCRAKVRSISRSRARIFVDADIKTIEAIVKLLPIYLSTGDDCRAQVRGISRSRARIFVDADIKTIEAIVKLLPKTTAA